MKTPREPQPDEHDLHAYVDGRLDPARARAVEAWLQTCDDPARAAEVRAWQRDAQQLRAALSAPEPMSDNPALDPARLRARRQARGRVQLAFAAALVVCTGAGGLGGWQLRARHDAFVPDMTDALEAHRMFATDGALKLDIVPRDAGEMQAWMDQHVTGAPRLPDLATAGFHPVGGRLFVTELGAAAVVVYRDGQGGAISFYVRPGVPQFPLPRGEHRDGPLVAQFGPVDRYWVAMVSNADVRDVSIVHHALPNAK